MTTPTVAAVIPVELGGEPRTLKYGFRALKAIEDHFPGINVLRGLGELLSEPTIERMAVFVRAGLLHEYAKNAPRHGQEPPSVDDMYDLLDIATFSAIIDKIRASAGVREPHEEAPENPPSA